MDVRINEVQSRVQATDSQTFLDPRILREIVRACVLAVKEDLAREKRIADECSMFTGISSKER